MYDSAAYDSLLWLLNESNKFLFRVHIELQSSHVFSLSATCSVFSPYSLFENIYIYLFIYLDQNGCHPQTVSQLCSFDTNRSFMYSKFWFTGNFLRIMMSKLLVKSPLLFFLDGSIRKDHLWFDPFILFLVDFTQNKRNNMVFIFSLLSDTVSQKLRFQVVKKLNWLLWLSVSSFEIATVVKWPITWPPREPVSRFTRLTPFIQHEMKKRKC